MTKIKRMNIFYHEQIEKFNYFNTRVHPLQILAISSQKQ